MWLNNNKIRKIRFLESLSPSRRLSKELSNLINLQKLSLNNNKIKETPKELGNLINLRILSLYNNRIKIIPKELCNIKIEL